MFHRRSITVLSGESSSYVDNKSALVIDDQESVAQLNKRLLELEGFAVGIVECGNVLLDRAERHATVAGERLNLTPKEFALLEHFAVNRGTILTRTQLLENVWRSSFDPGTNMVDVTVARLRAKLVASGADCRLQSKRGLGYVFADADSSVHHAARATRPTRIA
jgi:DNA-binding response OmpR family regulator